MVSRMTLEAQQNHRPRSMRTQKALLAAVGLLWVTHAAALESCPLPSDKDATLKHVEQLVQLMPSGFDTDQARRDGHLRVLADAFSESGSLHRAKALAQSMSSPIKRSQALGQLASAAARASRPDLAASLSEEALAWLERRTVEERMEAFRRLRTLWSGSHEPGMHRVDALLIDLIERTVAVPAERARELVSSAQELSQAGSIARAEERLAQARMLVGGTLGKPSPIAAVLIRASLNELRLDGEQAARRRIEDVRRPSERMFGLAKLAQALAARGQEVARVLTAIRDETSKANEVVWNQGDQGLLLTDVATGQAQLGDGLGALATLERAWRLVSALEPTRMREQVAVQLIFLDKLIELEPRMTAHAPSAVADLLRRVSEEISRQFEQGRSCEAWQEGSHAQRCIELFIALVAETARSKSARGRGSTNSGFRHG